MESSGDACAQEHEAIGSGSKVVLVGFCLASAASYRLVVGLLPASLLQAGALTGLAALFLALALLARRSDRLSSYWQIPFAFFTFIGAGVLGDQSGFVQQLFVRGVLHQSASITNPLASTVAGTVVAQVVSTACLVIPIIVLTKMSGESLGSIFLKGPRKWWPLVVGCVGFVLFYLVGFSGRAARFFPNGGVTRAHYLALTPALIVLVLCNGLREELWFRAIFLKRYGRFLSPLSSNVLSAVIFASFHVGVRYTPALVPFLVLALVLGLVFGYLMQKSDSVLASAILHAGSDIPIFLGYLSFVR